MKEGEEEQQEKQERKWEKKTTTTKPKWLDTPQKPRKPRKPIGQTTSRRISTLRPLRLLSRPKDHKVHFSETSFESRVVLDRHGPASFGIFAPEVNWHEAPASESGSAFVSASVSQDLGRGACKQWGGSKVVAWFWRLIWVHTHAEMYTCACIDTYKRTHTHIHTHTHTNSAP